MKIVISLAVLVVLVAGVALFYSAHGQQSEFYGFTMNTIDGVPVSLGDYSGEVVLVVNTASHCGFTPQFEGLEALYTKYRDQGFVILGFPSDSFNQELDTDAEIQQFCTLNYGVDFPMFSKISVKGEDIHPLYQYLTAPETGFSGDITWNFNKFLIDRKGTVIARWDSETKPSDPAVVGALETALAN